MSITFKFIFVVFSVFAFSGCAMFNPQRNSAKSTSSSGFVSHYKYRDLTKSWKQRTYWSNKSTRTANSSSTKLKHQRTVSGNAYLLGKYAEPSRLNNFSSGSFARPHPPVVARDTGPISSPAIKTAGASYADIADGFGDGALPRGLSYKVWFVKGKDKLGPDGRARIKRLTQNPGYQRDLWLRGHTLGDERDPEQLSIGRALAVRKQLRKEGFAHSLRIKYRNPKRPGRYVEVTLQ